MRKDITHKTGNGNELVVGQPCCLDFDIKATCMGGNIFYVQEESSRDKYIKYLFAKNGFKYREDGKTITANTFFETQNVFPGEIARGLGSYQNLLEKLNSAKQSFAEGAN